MQENHSSDVLPPFGVVERWSVIGGWRMVILPVPGCKEHMVSLRVDLFASWRVGISVGLLS
jgi:hypothetical protein